MGKDSAYNRYIKGILDCTFVIIFLIAFWWVYILIALAIKLDDPSGPVIFKQKRIGKHGKIYQMYKFRSMRVGTEHTESGVYSDSYDKRLTKVGRILRATSLDELPQFFNVLKGDLCLVGFRSPLTYHPWTWDKYTEEQKRMFDIKPGLTGWAQIHGRRTVEWNQRIAYNIWYTEHVSFWLDIKIMFMTIIKIFMNVDNENVGATVTTNVDELEEAVK